MRDTNWELIVAVAASLAFWAVLVLLVSWLI